MTNTNKVIKTKIKPTTKDKAEGNTDYKWGPWSEKRLPPKPKQEDKKMQEKQSAEAVFVERFISKVKESGYTDMMKSATTREEFLKDLDSIVQTGATTVIKAGNKGFDTDAVKEVIKKVLVG